MIIQICSQAEALALVAKVREKTAVISITSTDDEELLFPENSNVEAILRLKFNDLVSEFDEEGFPYGRPLPQLSDFSTLRDFVISRTCDRLIVHCWEGASRSAAVACAIYDFRGGQDELLPGPQFAPNPLVYTLASQALGIRLGRESFTASGRIHKLV